MSTESFLGGIGVDEFPGFEKCAEIQKLYLTDEAKGKGLGKALLETAENYAVQVGYKRLYLETHTNLEVAIHLYENWIYIHLVESGRPNAAFSSAVNKDFCPIRGCGGNYDRKRKNARWRTL